MKNFDTLPEKIQVDKSPEYQSLRKVNVLFIMNWVKCQYILVCIFIGRGVYFPRIYSILQYYALSIISVVLDIQYSRMDQVKFVENRRHPLKILNWYGPFQDTMSVQIFKGCFPQIYLSPFLNFVSFENRTDQYSKKNQSLGMEINLLQLNLF